jgi:hypothetical protein
MFLQTCFVDTAPGEFLDDDPGCGKAGLGCGCITFVCGKGVVPGVSGVVIVGAVGRSGEPSFGECDPVAFGGAADDGRDQPAPLVEEAGEVEVSLVVTRRE